MLTAMSSKVTIFVSNFKVFTENSFMCRLTEVPVLYNQNVKIDF